MKTFYNPLFLLFLVAAFTSSAQDWPIHDVRTDIVGAWTRHGDIDNDGDPDLLVQAGDSVLWYENLRPGWASHLIDPTFYNSAIDYVDLFDMEGDGDLDVLKCPVYAVGDDSLTWNENLDDGSTWVKHFIAKSSFWFTWMQSSYGDLDSDGDTDFAVGEGDAYPSTDGALYWLENDGNGSWSRNELAAGIIHWFAVLADIDGDEDLDIVSSDGNVFWLENELPDTSWDYHLIAEFPDLFAHITGNCADIDNDGDLDVITTLDENGDFIYYKNPDWEKVVLRQDGTIVYVCEFGDPDNDGDLDVPYGGSGLEVLPLGWLENTGDSDTWVDHPVSPASPLQQIPSGFADIDGDGDEDLVTLSYDPATGFGGAHWAENSLLSNTRSILTGPENAILSVSPNPFSSQTEIKYRLLEAGDLDLSVYNALGQKLSTLISGRKPAGEFSTVWSSNGLNPGAYLLHLTLNGHVKTEKLYLIND